MNRIGRSELNYGNHRSVAQTLATIDAVTSEEVLEVAQVLLTRPFAAAVVGPYKRVRDLPRVGTRDRGQVVRTIEIGVCS